MSKKINVTIWNEYRHERSEERIREIYPEGIHGQIAKFLGELDVNNEFNIRTATLDEPQNGLPDEVLNDTDVLLWWGHMAHHEVPDDLVNRITGRVYNDGMGFIALHSGHHSKPFRQIVGTTGNLLWSDNQHEIVWNVNAAHPIAAGIGEHIDLELEEMYGEPFAIPQPDELVFMSWFEHGYVFRSGCCWTKGRGRVFYFQPGHEECRSYYNPQVQRVIYNAVKWAKPNEFGAPVHHCDYRGNIC